MGFWKNLGEVWMKNKKITLEKPELENFDDEEEKSVLTENPSIHMTNGRDSEKHPVPALPFKEGSKWDLSLILSPKNIKKCIHI